MITVELNREDLASTRFVVSPLWETVNSLMVLAWPDGQVIHRPWLAQSRSRMAGADFGLLRTLTVPGPSYIPDFLTPVPGQPASLDAELAAMCGTPADRVRYELTLAYPRRPLPEVLKRAFDQPAAGLRQVAEQVRQYFDRVLAEHWTALRSVLDADVTYRGRQLAVSGPDQMLAGLHPLVSWTGTALQSRSVSNHHLLSARGRGMLLVPSVFSWPRAAATIDPGGLPALAYPPRAAASVWNGPRVPPRQTLSALLGATRATVLFELRRPRSTTEIARRLNVSASSASHHLHVLANADLISRRRQGRWVLYELTAKGETLIDGG